MQRMVHCFLALCIFLSLSVNAQSQAQPQAQANSQAPPQAPPKSYGQAEPQAPPKSYGQAEPQAQANAQVPPQTESQAQPQAQTYCQITPQVQPSGQPLGQAPASGQTQPQAFAQPQPQPQPQAQARSRTQSKFNGENQVPSAAQLESGRADYTRYCADCHGKEGEGKEGPALMGSLIVTGPIVGHIHVVLAGEQHKMPSWGITELSDGVIASIITYQRNAWGNNNKRDYGKNAGGVATPERVNEYRKWQKNLPSKSNVRI